MRVMEQMNTQLKHYWIVILLKKTWKSENLKVVIVGDIKHSRVALSNIYALKKLGAKVMVCGPTTLIPNLYISLV